MANTITNRFKALGMIGTIDILAGAGVKWMICDDVTAYTIDNADDFVDEAGANDPIDAEYAGTNYTGGFGGASRTVLGSRARVEDDANDRAEFDAADKTFSAIGSRGESINQLLIIDETGEAADTAADLIASLDSNLPVTTNGGDVTFQPDAQGLLQFA